MNLSMSKLANDIKQLVNDGVFSLHELQGYGSANDHYWALKTDQGDYFLVDREGEIIKRLDRASSLKLGSLKKFPEISNPQSLKVNIV